jgi:hypothetical protein
MAITPKIAATKLAVLITDATTEFITTGPFLLYADGLAIGEHVMLHRKGPSANFLPATDKNGPIILSAFPNWIYVEAGGTFRLTKTASAANVVVGYEEQ